MKIINNKYLFTVLIFLNTWFFTSCKTGNELKNSLKQNHR